MKTGVIRLLQLLLLASALLASMFGRTVLSPLQETVRLSTGFSDNQMALLQGTALAIPMALGSIPIGYCVDRISRTLILRLSITCSILSAIFAGIAVSFEALFAARCLAGLGATGILITVYAIVGDLFPPEQRGRASTICAAGECVGAPLCFAVGGTVLVYISEHPIASFASFASEDWRQALVTLGLVMVPILLLMFLLKEPARSEDKPASLPMKEACIKLWHYRTIALPVLFARGLVWIADGAVYVWSAPALARRHHLTPDTIGAMLGVALLTAGLIGPVVGGIVADHCQRKGGPRRTMLALGAIALLSAPTAIYPVMPTAFLSVLALGVFLTLGIAIATAGVALSIVAIPSDVRGFYLGVSFTFGSIFFVALAPSLVSGVSTALGGGEAIATALAIICCAASLLGAFTFVISARFIPRTWRGGDEAISSGPARSQTWATPISAEPGEDMVIGFKH